MASRRSGGQALRIAHYGKVMWDMPPRLLCYSKRKRSAFGRYSNRCETHIPYTLCLRAVATGSTPSLGLFLRGIPGCELAFDLRIIPTTYIFRCAFSGYASPMQTPTRLSEAHAALFRQKLSPRSIFSPCQYPSLSCTRPTRPNPASPTMESIQSRKNWKGLDPPAHTLLFRATHRIVLYHSIQRSLSKPCYSHEPQGLATFVAPVDFMLI